MWLEVGNFLPMQFLAKILIVVVGHMLGRVVGKLEEVGDRLPIK